MKALFMLFTLVLLPGCYLLDPNLPRPKAEYGRSSENTIAVTAGMGFRKPGVHHVQRGTTLREFMKIAIILPNREWGAAESYCGCHLRQVRDGKGVGFQSQAEPSEEQWKTCLEDGAIVDVHKWNL